MSHYEERKHKSEEDILKDLKNMTEEELKEYRNENKNRFYKIRKRTIRNIISDIIKRCIDILAGLVGTILLVPITIIVWIMSKINRENGPLFYDQLRIGKRGKYFKIYKFRSMCVGADDILQEYLDSHPKEKEEYRINKKLENDPRITKTGKIIRRLSLDEWPQFVSVLKGTMSLVGPRPYLPRERKDMGEYFYYIISVKPGLTGPWQVAGRSNLTFDDRLKLDEEYIARMGNRRDMKIIMKTFKKVLCGKEEAI